jgi:hypothetical protein
MLLTPPRPLDVMLGFAYICVSTIVYLASYFLNTPTNPDSRHLRAVFISYGYCQSIVGFFAGLCLARITQVDKTTDAQSVEEEEEAMLMVMQDV